VSAPADPVVDSRDAPAFVETLLGRRHGFVAKWQPREAGADLALAQVVGRYLSSIVTRLNRAPDKHQLAMLDQLGVQLIPAQAARAPVVFTLTANAGDARVPAGTRLAAKAPDPPPVAPTSTGTGDAPSTTPPGPILFETERATGLASAALVELHSLWPGRDQSIDHMPARKAGEALRPWLLSELEDMPHHIYIAHSTLLALAGAAHVQVDFELTQGASEPLDSIWEYWDGKIWRPFKNTLAACDRVTAAQEDSTARFRQTGTVHLLADCAEVKQTTVDGIENFWVRGRLTEPLPPDPARLLPEVDQVHISTVVTRAITAQLDEDDPVISGGFLPDKAVVDGAEADLSKPFYPFGMQPQPGSVFYFSSDDTFTKPGADLRVHFIRTRTPQDELQVTDQSSASVTTPLSHVVVWEYWNGREWVPLPGFASTGDFDLDTSLGSEQSVLGAVVVTVPPDMEPVSVAGVEARWMRVRLVSGGFGFKQTVTWTDSESDEQNTLTYVVSRPPALSEFKLGYSWTFGPFAPERVLTYNDFQYRDRSNEAVWPGRVFRPFTPPPDTTPALYLGFDKPLPVDELGLFFDIVDDPADSLGPALVWEYWDGGAWRPVRVLDETRRLRLPGLVGLIGPEDSRPVARFGTPRSWLRVRLKEDGPPGAPTIRAILPNATWAVQQESVVDDPIGASTGLPDQALTFRRVPVLPGEQVEVRELAGPRANVEWRILARELYPATPRAIAEIEALIGREGADTRIDYGRLRLQRDRSKQVTEAWVTWYGKSDLLRSGPNDRHYTLERSRGIVRFGDGTTGKVPPAGAAILARRYQTGGGSVGNVPAGAIAQLQGSIGGVDKVVNPVPAEGGADAETLGAVRARGPHTLHHRGRALSITDLATIAREASPAVAVATALPAQSAEGLHRPGHVTIVVIPASADPRPWPSFGLRERVRMHVEARAGAALAGLHSIDVTGPRYVALDVDATIVPLDANEAGAVETRSRAALARLLHPLYGGPDGGGWPPGRDAYLSDVATVLEHVDGVDHVESLAISVDGRIGGERVVIGAGRTVVAGDLRLKLAREN
jgi:hypothetical protein